MSQKLKSKWVLIYFFITGFFAFLWVIFRSGLNPKRLTYPCQQAAFPIASAWFLMLITTFGGLAITKRLRKQSIATLAVIFISFFMVSSTKSYFNRASVELPTWKVDNPVSKVYAMNNIPNTIGTLKSGDASVPNASLVDPAIDTMIKIMSGGGLDFHSTSSTPDGIVESDDIVVIKGNFQWKSRLSTHTDRIKGVIWNILNHPNGFTGEILVCDNTQSSSASIDEERNNSDDVEQSIVDVVKTFQAKGYPVHIVEWARWRGTWVGEYSDGDMTDGDVLNEDTEVSYPKFKSPGGAYISLSKGIWDTKSNAYDRSKLCIINFPVVKAHGMMGATLGLKNWVGVLSTAYYGRFGDYNKMHYDYFWSEYALISKVMEVTFPDLTIIDGTWTSTASNAAYTTSEMINTNCLVASIDPLAASWYAAKYILNPIAASKTNSDPDNLNGTYGSALKNLSNYLINTARIRVTKDPSKMSVYDRNDIYAIIGNINLKVNSGTGSGRYFEGETINISPVSIAGKKFSHWTGDTEYLESASTVAENKVTIPASDISLTAVYEDILFTLTVVDGSGSGTEYKYGQTVEIKADEASEGYVFSQWTGDVEYITSVGNPVTIVTLPAKDITVAATYKEENDNNNSSEDIPVFNWNMEATNVVLDEGSAKLDLTNNSSVTTGGTEPNPPGYGSVGAVFNGVDQYLLLKDSDYGDRALNGTDRDGTIYVAIKPSSISNHSFFWSLYSVYAGRQLALTLDRGKPKFYFGIHGGTYSDVEIPHTFSAGDEIIFALSLDAETKNYTFMVKDVISNEYYSVNQFDKQLTGEYFNSASDLVIGGRSDLSSSWFFNGTIYWVRVYDELHSEEKMKEIMTNNNRSLKGVTKQESITENELEAYPNPSNGIFTFEIEDISLADVMVTDASGRKIRPEITTYPDKISVDITGNPEGLYYISFKTEDRIITSKVLLRN